MSQQHEDASIRLFDAQYQELGLGAQRLYPNESLLRFLGTRFFGLTPLERAGIRILEVGCGSGANLWMMAKEGFLAYGVDASPLAVSLARKHLRKKWGVSAIVEVARFDDLAYPSDWFDVVCDVVSLQHTTLAGSRNALDEIQRVLKPGGLFFSHRLSDRSVITNAPGAEWVDAATMARNPDPTLPIPHGGLLSFWNPDLVAQMYGEAGLEVVSIERDARTYQDGSLMEYLSIVGRKGEHDA